MAFSLTLLLRATGWVTQNCCGGRDARCIRERQAPQHSEVAGPERRHEDLEETVTPTADSSQSPIAMALGLVCIHVCAPCFLAMPSLPACLRSLFSLSRWNIASAIVAALGLPCQWRKGVVSTCGHLYT
eukprot:1170675-Amphidinium_carterae.1